MVKQLVINLLDASYKFQNILGRFSVPEMAGSTHQLLCNFMYPFHLETHPPPSEQYRTRRRLRYSTHFASVFTGKAQFILVDFKIVIL